MKTIIITLILAITQSHSLFVQSTCSYQAQDEVVVEQAKEQNIQSRIMDAFLNSFVVQNNSEMLSIIDELSSMYDTTNNSLFLYWKGYAIYYNSIIYLKNGDNDKAYEVLKEGIDTLESITTKNAEDYALLSMMHSFSCQFLGFPKVVMASRTADEYIEKALKLDDNNLRVYYVMANNDYYTPKTYGGGKEVEKHALRALSLPAQEISNPYLPSWGRKECFELLTNHYIKNNMMDKAKVYVEQGLAEYPDSYTLKYNKSKLP